jgi:hypothetical protein
VARLPRPITRTEPGTATRNFVATDLEAARKWYSALVGAEASFVREGGYIGWRLGPREDEFGNVLGIMENVHFAEGLRGAGR